MMMRWLGVKVAVLAKSCCWSMTAAPVAADSVTFFRPRVLLAKAACIDEEEGGVSEVGVVQEVR